MSQIKSSLSHKKKFLFIFLPFILNGCGQKKSEADIPNSENIHVNFSLQISTLLLGVSDAQITEMTIQKSQCPDASEPLDYQLKFIPSNKNFVLNEQRSFIEGCTLQIRGIKVAWKELTVEYKLLNEVNTAAKSYEAVLSNSSQSSFIYVTMPTQVGTAIERDVFWSLNVSYLDAKSRLFPVVAEAREPGVEPLGLAISALEDRGVVNSIWRELGISLACIGAQSFGTCNQYGLIGLTARIVLQSQVDKSVAQQIRYQGALNDLLFTSGLTHLAGSGLRFTLEMPTSVFGQPLYLIVMRGQGYSVFELPPGLIPSTAK